MLQERYKMLAFRSNSLHFDQTSFLVIKCKLLTFPHQNIQTFLPVLSHNNLNQLRQERPNYFIYESLKNKMIYRYFQQKTANTDIKVILREMKNIYL